METATISTTTDTDWTRLVTPDTISAMLEKLREAADETLALATTVTHPQSVADLKATYEAIQRDIHQLEKLAASWQITVSQNSSAMNCARPPP